MTKVEDDILYIEKGKLVLQNIKNTEINRTKNISKNALFKKSICKSLFILLLICLIYLIINYSSKISFTNKRNTTIKEEFINKTEKELENINKNQTLIKDESKNKLEELKNKEDISKQKFK